MSRAGLIVEGACVELAVEGVGGADLDILRQAVTWMAEVAKLMLWSRR